MKRRAAAQLDLFAPKRRRSLTGDERKLMARLRSAVGGPEPVRFGGKAGLKRLMTPLPPITVPQ